MKNLKMMALALTTIFTLNSCSNDDSPVVEEELITTLTATFVGGGQTITLTSRDLDGDGPNAPVITVSGNFAAETTYSGSVQFLNELENPAENITEEIEEKDLEHQVFYQISNSLGNFTYSDFDTDGNPLGLEFTFTTGANPGTGTITITLRHLPNKNAAGVSEGNITNAGGSTDVEVSFPVVVI
ncbi:type 1 periplasmic binding fold superfamily protein [Flavobacterium azooxidireducens]|uniref:Type 1 periplasmic binding fold superfamily protein n=1 Tax=Flavobacterium azooxidireducens TaxID=1871076 RepID=A0ABY4KIR5_9FLAO|nr:type 1 periplasmic binding fold superfamily protein [Flavobacterium azooxidireducens]UPQ80705.1 type 1 periplasmic binding fold superfamily protein [Flavobacterium azooxidireducens]